MQARANVRDDLTFSDLYSFHEERAAFLILSLCFAPSNFYEQEGLLAQGAEENKGEFARMVSLNPKCAA